MSDFDEDSIPGLDELPEPMQSKLRQRIASLPAPAREKLLREGLPKVERLLKMLGGNASRVAADVPRPPGVGDLLAALRSHESRADTSAATAPDGSSGGTVRTAKVAARTREVDMSVRIPTVAPGDTSSQRGWVVGGAIALIGAVWYALQG